MVAVALGQHGFPHAGGRGLGFTSEDDALFERGYPHLRFVTDKKVSQGKNPARTNAAPHHAAYALPWILRRVDASLATELRARIGRVEAKSEGETNPVAYFVLLAAIANPPASTCDLVLALAYDLRDCARRSSASRANFCAHPDASHSCSARAHSPASSRWPTWPCRRSSIRSRR